MYLSGIVNEPFIFNKESKEMEPRIDTIVFDRQAVTPPRRERTLLYMYGAVTKSELNSFLEINSVDSNERKNNLKSNWLGAAEFFQELVKSEKGIAETISSKQFSSFQKSFVATLQGDQSFTRTFSNFPLTFEEIEIDRIVAAQRCVHLEYIEKLKNQYVHSDENILKFCLDTGGDSTPLKVGRSAQNSYTLSSENPGLRFLGVYDQPYISQNKSSFNIGGQPVQSVVIVLGYGASTMNVYRVGKRVILNNGFHRLYTLRSLGISHAPVVVQHVTNPELELPPVIADLPREYLVSSARPALMKDFFEPTLTCEIHQPEFIKALQVGWGINENIVPR